MPESISSSISGDNKKVGRPQHAIRLFTAIALVIITTLFTMLVCLIVYIAVVGPWPIGVFTSNIQKGVFSVARKPEESIQPKSPLTLTTSFDANKEACRGQSVVIHWKSDDPAVQYVSLQLMAPSNNIGNNNSADLGDFPLDYKDNKRVGGVEGEYTWKVGEAPGGRNIEDGFLYRLFVSPNYGPDITEVHSTTAAITQMFTIHTCENPTLRVGQSVEPKESPTLSPVRSLGS